MTKSSKVVQDHHNDHLKRVIKFSNSMGDTFQYIRPADVVRMQVNTMGDVSLFVQGVDGLANEIAVFGTEAEIAALIYPDGAVDAPVGGGV